jgi:hypothetical protein
MTTRRTAPTARPLTALASLLAALLAASVALAQGDADRATARALAEQAQDALEAKDYARAADLFDRAAALVRAPTLSLGRARALAGLGELVAAHEAYQKILRDGVPADASPAFARAIDEARGELAALAARLPAATVRIDGPRAPEVMIDGEPVPATAIGVSGFVDPGAHVVRAEAPGFVPAESTFTVKEGERIEVRLALVALAVTPTATATPPPDDAGGGGWTSTQIAGLAVGGVGMAALGVSLATGVAYLGAESDVEAHCDDTGACDPEGLDAAESGETLGVVNTVTLFGGAALIAAGAVLFVTGRRDEASPAAGLRPPAVWIGPGGGGAVLRGGF